MRSKAQKEYWAAFLFSAAYMILESRDGVTPVARQAAEVPLGVQSVAEVEQPQLPLALNVEKLGEEVAGLVTAVETVRLLATMKPKLGKYLALDPTSILLCSTYVVPRNDILECDTDASTVGCA